MTQHNRETLLAGVLMMTNEPTEAQIAARSASNPPTTNGEVTPRAASDDEVERVAQKHPFGCAVASLAALLRKPYAEAAMLLSDDPTQFQTSGVGFYAVELKLADHGFAVAKKYAWTQPGNKLRDKWPCEPFADIHWCEVITEQGAHAVLMLRDGQVIDPAREKRARLSDYQKVNMIAGLAALSTPTTDSAVDDPETAKGGG